MPDADGYPTILDAIEVLEERKRTIGCRADRWEDLAENIKRLGENSALVIAGLGINAAELGQMQAQLAPAFALLIPLYGPVGATVSAWADGLIIGVIYAELLNTYNRKDTPDA